MAPDQRLCDDLSARGFDNVAVVARGVDTTQFDPARRSDALRASWGAARDDLVVLHVGRRAPEKNLDTLASAFAAIRQRQPRSRLVLVGDGPARATIRSRCPDAVFAGMRHGDSR